MFKIESNLAGVIRQTERLMENIPPALNRALQPDRWQADARDMAQSVLLTLASPQERRFVPSFVATVTAAVWDGDGLSLTMQTPFPELTDALAAARAARGVTSNKDLGMGLFDLPLQEFANLILKWVETPEDQGGKRRDSRDAGKTDEEIARLITYIMLAPNLGPKGMKARAGLTPHIEAFLKSSQADRLTPETVDLWLRAVLEAWREMVRMKYPAKVKAELNAMKGELV